MTFREAVQANITRIRLPQWADRNYLRIHVTDPGPDGRRMHGPWAKLYAWDEPAVETLIAQPGATEGDWLAYEGERSPLDVEGVW